jgi:hypothetical protein
MARLARPSASACSATALTSGAGAQPKVSSDQISQANGLRATRAPPGLKRAGGGRHGLNLASDDRSGA